MDRLLANRLSVELMSKIMSTIIIIYTYFTVQLHALSFAKKLQGKIIVFKTNLFISRFPGNSCFISLNPVNGN
jgi:hypothetical protein